MRQAAASEFRLAREPRYPLSRSGESVEGDGREFARGIRCWGQGNLLASGIGALGAPVYFAAGPKLLDQRKRSRALASGCKPFTEVGLLVVGDDEPRSWRALCTCSRQPRENANPQLYHGFYD